jgi:carboxyl-terminal processing protease
MFKKISIYTSVIIFIYGIYSFAPRTQDFEVMKNLEIFADVFKIVNYNFIEEIDPKQLLDNAIYAMVQSLDPYTDYIPKEDMDDYKFIMSGKYGGIGATVRKKGAFVYISEPYQGFPADKAGLKAADKILEIDGNNCENKEVEDVIDLLKGNPGTKLKMTIQRYGEKEKRKVEFSREIIQVQNVPYYSILKNDIGYILLTTFSDDAGKNVRHALKEMQKQKTLNGVILDLRDNGGGLLGEAVDVVNVFVPKGMPIVETKSRIKKMNFLYRTLDNALDENIPLAVLINNGTASASEIVSGSIQDYDRGIIIGQRSFGKGLVQTTENLAYNGKLKYTSSKYYLHSGRCVQAIDYSKRYTDGVIDNIPDSLRQMFYTINKRKVYDGGGVDPDFNIENKKYNNIVKSLYVSEYLFDFASEYVFNNPNNSNWNGISDNDFNLFLNFIKDKKLEHLSNTEIWLDSLKAELKRDKMNMALENKIEILKTKLNRDKIDDIIANKSDIIDIINKEIISRYTYLQGRIQYTIQHDNEVNEAIKILLDKEKYKSTLKKNNP